RPRSPAPPVGSALPEEIPHVGQTALVVAGSSAEHVEEAAEVGHRLSGGLPLPAEQAPEDVREPATAEQVVQPPAAATTTARLRGTAHTAGQPGHHERSEDRQQLREDRRPGLAGSAQALFDRPQPVAEHVAEDLLPSAGSTLASGFGWSRR